MVKSKYWSKWIEYKLIPLGGLWAFAVGIIEDESGNRKIRIAKGRINGKFRSNPLTKEIEIFGLDKENPIVQISRLNIKHKKEWDQIKKYMDSYIRLLSKKK